MHIGFGGKTGISVPQLGGNELNITASLFIYGKHSGLAVWQ